MLRAATLSLAALLCACGVSVLDDNLPPVPTITSFTAAPAALGAGGGTSLLSWTVVNADNLNLTPPNTDVSSFTSAKVTATETTTYTLSASNSLGETKSSLTLTVGP